MSDTCDECGDTFESYAAYQRHNCNTTDAPPKPESLFGVEEARQREAEYRRGNEWLERHNYL